MKENALRDGIEYKSYKDFVERCTTTLKNFSKDIIDGTIDSMDKRINQIIEAKGQSIKY